MQKTRAKMTEDETEDEPEARKTTDCDPLNKVCPFSYKSNCFC